MVLYMYFDGWFVWCFCYLDIEIFCFVCFKEENVVVVVKFCKFVEFIEFSF